MDIFPTASRQGWHYLAVDSGLSRAIVPVAMLLRGCETATLQVAIADLVGRHEALRTRLGRTHRGEVWQVVERRGELPIEEVELPDAASEEAPWREVVRQAATEPFDVRGGRLARARLCHTAPGEAVLALAVHHAVADGWSARVIYRDLAELYLARCEGREADLPELEVQMGDYAVWERGAARENPGTYWRELLSEGNAPLGLAVAGREMPAEYRVWSLADVSAGTMDGIRALARARRTTEARVVWAAVLGALAPLYSGPDVTVAAYVSNRERPELQNVVGELTDLMPVRVTLSGQPQLGELVGRVQEAVRGALEHKVPCAALVDLIRANPERREGPIVDVMLNYLPPAVPATDVERHGRVEELDAGVQSGVRADHWWDALGHLDVHHRPRADGGLTGHLIANARTVPRDTVVRVVGAIGAAIEAAGLEGARAGERVARA